MNRDSTVKPSSDKAFTKETLPIAIGNLFTMNNYDVSYNVHVHGAEVDIVAKSKGDPFSNPVYIEATVEYVSTEKYGKDTTKFLLLSRKVPGATLLCVSAVGFTAPIKERALESGVSVMTYDELFSKFEKFAPYLELIFSRDSTRKLIQAYEQPYFNDSKGRDLATKWLGYWKGYAPDESKWLIILGEYGTGKTSLTRVLQYRWLEDYHSNPSLPIPIRIELRNFSRQFDAVGLLHHFLDTNKLSHVPIEFMMHLIRTGRVILLLDGYDEMAQFMNSRERRACLAALAELAKDGAKGVLTSRPNYFSENEELNVFEALYRNLERQRYFLSKKDADFIENERLVDQMVEKYVLNRYERNLQDLTPEQTESLVKRSLAKNIKGQKIVLSILNRVFREESQGNRQSLSGKPVIVSYLLELVEDIQKDPNKVNFEISPELITEWEIYKLILDRLMLRDLQRSTLPPEDRRKALQNLAIRISERDKSIATEETFLDIIDSRFQSELRRLSPEERRTRRLELFEDLRSSATLTRAIDVSHDGWVFSHNSLREYLACEAFVESLLAKSPAKINIPITAAMRGFVASIDHNRALALWQILSNIWLQRSSDETIGLYLSLLWESGIRSLDGIVGRLSIIGALSPERTLMINNLTLKDIDFSGAEINFRMPINASGSSLADCRFDGMDLSRSVAEYAILDNISFKDCNLSGSKFDGCFFFECEFSGATIEGASFRDIDADSSILVRTTDGVTKQLTGKEVLGYLAFNGGATDSVDPIHIYKNHPKFPLIAKICEKVSEQRHSQLRGLTQRGESRIDPPFAREFVSKLEALGWATVGRNDLVSATQLGRPELAAVASGTRISQEIVEFIQERGG